ncbi:MAG: Trk system potassium transporter TrkA [Rubrivivax sp.]|nr:Trk system potassium transporter TrkA [Rubrivivax sp.]
MRVLILGGGQVGALIARRLTRENNEVALVEINEDRCRELEEALDVKVICGNARSIDTLRSAGLDDAEMLIAVTESDETNILGCLIAQALSGVKIKVLRLRTHEVDHWRSICESDMLKVDLVIHPDRETVDRILNVLGIVGVSEIYQFADGRLKLFGMNIEAGSWVIGKTIKELAAMNPVRNALMAIIFRGHRVIIPHGGDDLRAGDHVYIMVPSSEYAAMAEFVRLPPPRNIQRVFIVGGRQIGIEAALRLEKQGVAVKIFERDLRRCELISGILKKSVVVHADGMEQKVLSEENIEGIDAYLALSADDEDNIIACLLARRLGASKAVALVNRLELLPMAQMLGINSIFSTRLVVVDRILQFVRKGKVFSVTTFRNEEVEALEMVAAPRSKFVGKPLRALNFPRGVIVGAIARPSGEVTVPSGDAVIQPGDRVVFFCLEQVVKQLESAFLA